MDAYVRSLPIVEKLYIVNYPLSTTKMRIDVRVDEEKIDLFQLRLCLNNFLMMSSKSKYLDSFNDDLNEHPDVSSLFLQILKQGTRLHCQIQEGHCRFISDTIFSGLPSVRQQRDY